MKKKIAIFGSTGSIGKTLLELIEKDKENFEVTLLTANKNYKDLIKQAKYFNVKNIIISDNEKFNFLRKNYNLQKINVYEDFSKLRKIFKKKNDFIMSSITGIDGLKPTLECIKYTKNILIANKEALICGWNLIDNELKKHKTDFIPVDSEHFSIWSLLKDELNNDIEKIYLTASGGPFLNLPKKSFSRISIKNALKHPSWKMGKKISIDSSTMMNKLFEVIEAKNIFNLPYKKISILIHPKSYIHAIIKFNNGLTKILLHDTSMKIPIFNALYHKDRNKILLSKKLDINKLNTLDLRIPDINKFPLLKIKEILPSKISLFETILISVNDEVVDLFLKKEISYKDINKLISKIINLKEFRKYKKISPKNLKNITELSNFVRLKTKSIVYKSG